MNAVAATGAPRAPAARPPFDINDYGRTADSIAAAARELRGLADDLRNLLESDRLNRVTNGTLDQTALRAQALVNQMTWRGAMLILLAFALSVTYRLKIKRA